MNVFDPNQSLNAFASGAQMGGAIRNKQTANALAPMVASGDYEGAMAYAGSRGDLAMMDYVRPQAEAAKSKALKQGIGNALASGDTKGAMAQAYGAGEIETGMALYGHNRAMKADEITDQKSGIDYLVSNVDQLMTMDENDPRRADEAMRIIMDSPYGQDPNVVSAVQAAIADGKLSNAELKQFQQQLLTPAQRIEGQRYDAEQEYTQGRDKVGDDQWKMEYDRKLAADRAAASAASAKADADAKDAAGYRFATPEEVAAAGLPEGTVAQISPKNQMSITKDAPGAPKPLIGAESMPRVVANLPNMKNAVAELKDLMGNRGTDAPKSERGRYSPGQDWGAKAIDAIPDFGLLQPIAKAVGGQDYQRFNAAFKTFSGAILPILSGAAVSPSEKENILAAIEIRVGDSDPVAQSKLQQMENMTIGLEAAARGDIATFERMLDEAAAYGASLKEQPSAGGDPEGDALVNKYLNGGQ
jgi:hypothetical protein